MWKYVPAHQAAFECLDASLPLITRLAIFASHWVIRVLPQLIFLGLLLIGGTAALGAILAIRAKRSVTRTLAVLAFAVACAEGIACGFLVHSIHEGYRATGCDPQGGGGPQKCQECRVGSK
jgi:hypothetical protein